MRVIAIIGIIYIYICMRSMQACIAKLNYKIR